MRKEGPTRVNRKLAEERVQETRPCGLKVPNYAGLLVFTGLVLCDFLVTCFPIFKVVARNLCGVACGVGAVAGQTALGSATSQAAPGGAQQLSGGDAPCMGACWPHMRKSPPSRRLSTSNRLLTVWQVSQWGFCHCDDRTLGYH